MRRNNEFQIPITREISQLSVGNFWRSVPLLAKFVFRIITEGRGDEIFFNALREIRYAFAPAYDDSQAVFIDMRNLKDLHSHLAPQLAPLGYRKELDFSSTDEEKCIVVSGGHLVCMTREELRFYDNQHVLLRSIEVNGYLSNFVHVAGRIYFVVDGSLYSVTIDGEVRDENLAMSATASTVLDQGIAMDDCGNLVVAEYKHDALGKSGAYLYVRRSGDIRWETINTLALQVDKHCHIVVCDSLSHVFYVTCGDTRKMLVTLDLREGKLQLDIISGGAMKTGGYMCAVPWKDGLLCGTDYTGGTNFLVLVRNRRIQGKEALRKPFRRSIVSSIEAVDQHILFAAWNMGYLPKCSNGILLKSPSGTRPLCYSDDLDIEFELFPSAEALVVRGATPERRIFGIYRRS